MSNPNIDGILRCMICGNEHARVSAGLNYGFPKCCKQTMRVITPRELQEERDYQETLEQEENFMRSTG